MTKSFTQRRKGAKARLRIQNSLCGLLCAFAPLRENHLMLCEQNELDKQ